MKKLLTTLIGAVILSFPIYAQPQPPGTLWTQTYGGNYDDRSYYVQQTEDGGFITTGYTHSYGAGGCDIWLIKTDAEGNLEWEQTFGGCNNDGGYCVQQTSDGGYIVVGYTYSFGAGSYDAWLIKTDAIGNVEWDQTYGGGEGDDGHYVQQTIDGGYIIAGGTYSYGVIWDVWLIKTDANGNEEWNQVFGGGGYQAANCVQQTEDGGYIVSSYTTPYCPHPWDAWLIKTDQNGILEWDQTYGGEGGEYGAGVQQTEDGGYIFAGFTDSYGAGLQDFWLVKTDQNGTEEWNQTYGGSGADEASSVQLTNDGGYVLVGFTESYGAGSKDFWLVKTDATGNLEWEETYGGLGDDLGRCVQQTGDEGYILAGWTDSFGAGGFDVWLIRLEGDGVLNITLTPYNPPIVIPPGGDAFAYNIAGANSGSSPAIFDAWVNIEVPGGYSFTVLGPVYDITMAAGSSIERDRTVFVPGNAPAGEYICMGMIGTYPWNVVDMDAFPFFKAGADGIWKGSEGWICSGEPFPGEDIATEEALPEEFALQGAFPNPFNPSTTLSYALPKVGKVSLVIYNVQGREVDRLIDGWTQAGFYQMTFDASQLSSGIYFARLTACDFHHTQKLILLR